jgi:hypothetical protein
MTLSHRSSLIFYRYSDNGFLGLRKLKDLMKMALDNLKLHVTSKNASEGN